MEEDFSIFVGVDWSTEFHQVCILDANGKIKLETQVLHSFAGLATLVELVSKATDGNLNRAAVSIEVPRGAIVETMLEKGAAVYSINPKQLDRFRDRHTVAGAKDDRRDALVLADSLRTDRKSFRRLNPDAPIVLRIRELSRMDGALRDTANRLTNQLREQVGRIAPHVLKLCRPSDEPWFWTLLDNAISVGKFSKLREQKIDKILKEHRIRKITAKEVFDVLQETPIYVVDGTVEAAFRHMKMLVPQLQLIHDQRKECCKEISAALEEFQQFPEEAKENKVRDAEIILSIPGVGNLIAATILAEASDPIQRRDFNALRAHSGVAPVTKRSGKKLVVCMRNACNPRLRNAFYHWARVAIQSDPVSRQKYSALRSRGHAHGRALRTVADGLLRMLIAMLKTNTGFSKEKREASNRVVAA